MVKVTFDKAKWDKAIADYMAMGQVSGAGAVTMASRIWLRGAVRLTVPGGSGSELNKTSAQKKLGEKLVRVDGERLFVEYDKIRNGIKSNRLRDRLDETFGAKLNLKTAVKILSYQDYKFQPMAISKPRDHLRDKHITGKRGHIGRNQVPYLVVQKGSVEKWIKSELPKVGMAKSGWKKAAAKLNVKLPSWVMRHAGEGYFLGRTIGDMPFIEFANEVEYAGKNATEDRVMARSREWAARMFQQSVDFYWKQVKKGNMAQLKAKIQKDTFSAIEA